MVPVATVAANTGAARSATITFTATGGTGDPTPGTLTINQLGAAPGISVTSMPTNLTMLAAAGGTVTATIDPFWRCYGLGRNVA